MKYEFQTGDTTLVDAAFRVPGKSFLMRMQMQQTAQELRMLSSSLFDCQSLTLNIKIRVSQFVGIVHCFNKGRVRKIKMEI